MAAPQPPSLHAGRVLVVEDDAELLELLLRGLREEGFAATGAASGHQGLARAEGSRFDALVARGARAGGAAGGGGGVGGGGPAPGGAHCLPGDPGEGNQRAGAVPYG